MKTNQLIEVLNSSDQTKSARLLSIYISSSFSKGKYGDVAEIVLNLNKLFNKVPKQIFLPTIRAAVFGSVHSKLLRDSLEQSIFLIKEKGATTWKVSQKEIDQIVSSIKLS